MVFESRTVVYLLTLSVAAQSKVGDPVVSVEDSVAEDIPRLCLQDQPADQPASLPLQDLEGFEAVSVEVLAIAAVGSEEASVAAIVEDLEADEVGLDTKEETALVVEEADSAAHQTAMVMDLLLPLTLLQAQVEVVQVMARVGMALLLQQMAT